MRAGYVTGLIRNTGENPLHVFLSFFFVLFFKGGGIEYKKPH